MKDFFKENKGVSWLIFISVLLIIIPISCYIIKFKDHNFSNDPAVWGTFGDFIGGTINTILSLSSLVILAILTSSVSKQSSEENKKNSFLLKRLDSYEQLTYFLTKVRQIIMHLEAHTTNFESGVSEILSDDYTNNHLSEYKHTLIEFLVFATSFNERFGHLYKYDFESDEYVGFIKSIENARAFFVLLISKINGNDLDKKLDSKMFDDFHDKFSIILNNLSKELN